MTSLVEIMNLAAVVHRLGERNGRRWQSAADPFRMATLGGARGRLEPYLREVSLSLLEAFETERDR